MAGPEMQAESKDSGEIPLIYFPAKSIVIVDNDPVFPEVFEEVFLGDMPEKKGVGKYSVPIAAYSYDSGSLLKKLDVDTKRGGIVIGTGFRERKRLLNPVGIDYYPDADIALKDPTFNTKSLGGSIIEMAEDAEADSLDLIKKLHDITAGKVFSVVFGRDIPLEYLAALKKLLQTNSVHAVMENPSSIEEMNRFSHHFANIFLVSEFDPRILKKLFSHQPEGGPATIRPKDIRDLVSGMINTSDPKVILPFTHAIIQSISYFTTQTIHSVF